MNDETREAVARLANGVKWAVVPWAPTYAVTVEGSVISTSRREPFFMRPIRMGEYKGLQLATPSGLKKEYLHRIVARVFLGEPPTGMQCAHLDGNRANNSVSNLEWVLPVVNSGHKKIHGTSGKGESNSMAKLTTPLVKRMRAEFARQTMSYSQIAKRYNVSTMTAYRAIKKQSWANV